MTMSYNNILTALCLASGLCLGMLSCNPKAEADPMRGYHLTGGRTMGTTYSLKFKYDGDSKALNNSVDSLFKAINAEVSTYIPEASVSRFNQSKEVDKPMDFVLAAPHFLTNLQVSREVYEQTQGKFDPTVMPLVNYWGFGYEKRPPRSSSDADSIKTLLEAVGFGKITLSPEGISKSHPNTQLDFSAIAKGYAADQAGKLLKSRGIENFLVEVGGEVYAEGVNPNGEPFVIGINKPLEEAAVTDFTAYLGISNKAVATSGNYRNYYEVDGKKISHTISPETGRPERSTLLSATIVAPTCMRADAYATACMVMGEEDAMKMVSDMPELEGFFIFIGKNGALESSMTPGFKKYMMDYSD